MTDTEKDNLPENALKQTRGDAVHTGVKLGLSLLPLASDIFELLIAAPASKRKDAFLISLYEGLKQLEEKYNDFSIESITENEVFQTTVIQATQAAIRTHSKEKHEALRNVVLNSAISKTPDENRQAMFIRLCDELTEIHIQILKLFQENKTPKVDLDLATSNTNTAAGILNNWIENIYPDLKGKANFYNQSIADLRSRNLITNMKPISAAVQVSPFAEDFLSFLKNPLD